MVSIKPVLKIRTDGSHEIGLGHVVRCISLAHMLKDDFAIHFFILKIPDSLKSEIKQNGWLVTVLEKESDFLNKLTGNEIVVLDGYQFDSDFQRQIKRRGCKLVCIDDFHDQHFYADLVINHAPGVSKDDYEGESYTKYLLGPHYALLRPEFLNSRKQEKMIYSESVNKILICFGGADSKNLTAKVLSWIPSKDYSITVILGNAYVHHDALNQVIAERKDFEIIVKESLDAKEMRIELEDADLGIVPASGVLLETFYVNLPSVSGYYADNQKGIYKNSLEKQYIVGAGDFRRGLFIQAFENILDIEKRISICKRLKKTLSSKSTLKIKEYILEL